MIDTVALHHRLPLLPLPSWKTAALPPNTTSARQTRNRVLPIAPRTMSRQIVPRKDAIIATYVTLPSRKLSRRSEYTAPA